MENGNMKTISLVAGPCSAESRTQMLDTARGLKEIGVGTLRAGLWKPRSRCGTFEGIGEEGLDARDTTETGTSGYD